MVQIERGLDHLQRTVKEFVDTEIDPFIDYCLTPHFHGRKFLQAVLPRAFPYEFTDFEGGNTFARIEENRKKGIGTIVGVTHFDKGEVLAVIGMILNHLSDKYLASGVKVVIPASYHQRNQVSVLAGLGDIDMAYVVNEDTMALERLKEKKRQGTIFSRLSRKKKLELGMGISDYLKKAVDAVRSGGTVYAAIQGGRRSQLGDPGIVLSLLLNHLERNGLTNYDILLIGSGLRVWKKDKTERKSWYR